MPIKIQNGYKIPMMSLTDLDVFMSTVRTEIRQITRQLIVKRASDLAVDAFYYTKLPNKYKKCFPAIRKMIQELPGAARAGAFMLGYTIMQTHEELVQKRDIQDPFFDFETNIVFFPMQDSILFMLFTQQESVKAYIESLEIVEPYNYDEDNPGDLTELEMQERKQLWLESVGETGIPKTDGYVIPCHSTIPIFYVNEVEDYIKENFNYGHYLQYLATKVAKASPKCYDDETIHKIKQELKKILPLEITRKELLEPISAFI